MGNHTAIIYTDEVSLKTVMFHPIIDTMVQVCRFGGITSVLLVCDKERVARALSELFEGQSDVQILQATDRSNLFAVRDFVAQHQGDEEEVVFITANLPLLTKEILEKSYSLHQKKNNHATCTVEKPENGALSIYQAAVQMCMCWFKTDILQEIISWYDDHLSIAEALIDIHTNKGGVSCYACKESEKLVAANNCKAVNEINAALREKILNRHLENGVNIPLFDGVLIEDTVEIGENTTILPGTLLRGNTSIGENCVIGANSVIENSKIENDVVFNASQCYNSIVHSGAQIGPFCHIRPNSEIMERVKIGDFVEIKNAVIGEETAVSHLTYIGDSDVGKRVNFGCGCVTVNYDGVSKARCTIGDGAFIGCNTNLVAPVTVGENAYVAAGSTITKEVAADALAIARARQVNKEGYAKGRYRRAVQHPL